MPFALSARPAVTRSAIRSVAGAVAHCAARGVGAMALALPLWAGAQHAPHSGHAHPAPAASAPAPAGVGAPAPRALDAHTREDIERHQGMARAHTLAAQCLAAGQPEDSCQKQLQAACKGLALGKHCGMRHSH